MRKFDTKVQYLKYKVLREVARQAWEDRLKEAAYEIPKIIVPGKEPTMRCCVYKERAILGERVQLAMHSCLNTKEKQPIIHVIDIACDECPVGGYEVTNACRGCIAHRCEESCPRGAITFDNYQKAHIDKSKCIECGKCAKQCPYSAIANNKRPCENACKVKALSVGDTKAAFIHEEKCVSCGACVYQCPFGAISDSSFILDAISLLKNKSRKVYAVVAPSIASQFSYAALGQVVAGLKELGFHTVVEAALGADMVADAESFELTEKGLLTSSCCPAFVSYIEKAFPTMVKHISHNLSPMTVISKYVKESDPTADVVFIGPCTAKKQEFQKESVRPYVDCVITFEELQALFDSRDIDLTMLPEALLDNASYFGRIFARSGGLTDAVTEALTEHGENQFELRPVVCNGIDECRVALLKLSKGIDIGNFIEGMACTGGCIGGAGCLTHGEKNKSEVDAYGQSALEKTIKDAISVLKS